MTRSISASTVLALSWLCVPVSGCDRPSTPTHEQPAVEAEKTEPSEKANPPESAAEEEPPNSACDTDELRKAAERIAERSSSWTPRTGVMPDFSLDAISAVWTHCPALPDEAKFLLHAGLDHSVMPSLADIAAAEGRPAPAKNDDPLDAKLEGHARFHEVDDALRTSAWDWRASQLCPDYRTLREEVGMLAMDDRKPITWDRCLHRFDFISRDEYLRANDDAGNMGFAVHRWLTDAKVDASIAKTLARAIMLGKHWLARGRTGLRFPVVETPTPLGEGMVIEFRPDSLYAMGRRIATFDPVQGFEGGLVSSGGESVVPWLLERVTEELDRSTAMAKERGRPWTPEVLVLVHRDLAWSVVRPVLASAHVAGARRIAVAGLADDVVAPLRSVVVHDASATVPPLTFSDTTTVQPMLDAVLASSDPVRLFEGR